MEIKRQVVMIDPQKIRDKALYPGEIARVEFVSDIHCDTAIVYFDDRGIYNAYNTKNLLVIYPEKIIFENICRAFGKLDKDAMRKLFTIVTSYQKRDYEISFRLALKNMDIATLCMTDFENFLKMKKEIEK